MARGSNQREGRAARSELESQPKGLPKSCDCILYPDEWAYDRADEKTYRAFNSTKKEFEDRIDSMDLKLIPEASFKKTAVVNGEKVTIERVFKRTIDHLDSQNKSGFGVRETYTITRGGKENWWYYYGVTA